MAHRTSLRQIEQSIEQLLVGLETAAARFEKYAGDYKPTAVPKVWAKGIENHTARLEELKAVVQSIPDYANSLITDARQSALPDAKNAEEVTASELTAARWLARGVDLDLVNKAIEELPASSARTLILEEAIARGVIEPYYLEVAIQATAEGKAAYEEARVVNMAWQALADQLQRVEALVEDYRATVSREYFINIDTFVADDDIVHLKTLLTRWTAPKVVLFHGASYADRELS